MGSLWELRTTVADSKVQGPQPCRRRELCLNNLSVPGNRFLLELIKAHSPDPGFLPYETRNELSLPPDPKNRGVVFVAALVVTFYSSKRKTGIYFMDMKYKVL